MVLTGEVFDRGEGGRYTVKECLGRGGMGEVYRAEYVAADAKGPVQVFALKMLRPNALPRHERHFGDEMRLLSLLHHKHIARFHDFFVDNGRQVLVMEYVEGRSLHSILSLARRKGRTLSEPTSLELLAQVADALGYTHAAKDEDGCPLNIVHRDVSPSNIMVNSAGEAVLMDFGVARADLEERTQTRSGKLNLPGKPGYFSPEQVLVLPVDGRSDLFALGSILVEMLTGEPPFGRTGDFSTRTPSMSPMQTRLGGHSHALDLGGTDSSHDTIDAAPTRSPRWIRADAS
jgi:serine/threonine-protein kinase